MKRPKRPPTDRADRPRKTIRAVIGRPGDLFAAVETKNHFRQIRRGKNHNRNNN